MTVQQILKTSPKTIEKMNRSDLARAVSALASVANKRVVRLENAGLTDVPAYKYVQKRGKFSVKGKNKEDLTTEFVELKRFLGSETKTSTVRGAREYHKKLLEATEKWMASHGASPYNDLSDEEKKAFWKWFDRESVQQILELYFAKYRKNALPVAVEIYHSLKNKDPRIISDIFESEAQKKYFEVQKQARSAWEQLNDVGWEDI